MNLFIDQRSGPSLCWRCRIRHWRGLLLLPLHISRQRVRSWIWNLISRIYTRIWNINCWYQFDLDTVIGLLLRLFVYLALNPFIGQRSEPSQRCCHIRPWRSPFILFTSRDRDLGAGSKTYYYFKSVIKNWHARIFGGGSGPLQNYITKITKNMPRTPTPWKNLVYN